MDNVDREYLADKTSAQIAFFLARERYPDIADIPLEFNPDSKEHVLPDSLYEKKINKKFGADIQKAGDKVKIKEDEKRNNH